MTNYLDKDVREINKLLKEKKIKVVDLINEAFEKIEKYKDYNIFITLNKEKALEEARKLDDIEVDNLLFGLPIIVKDNILTKDLRTTCASKMLDNFIPTYDATVIKKLKEKHMIIIGKANMDEFAMGSTGETSYYGSVIYPFDKTRVPAGSSSGPAVGVALNISPFALGSDTGGSIRQPASFNGLVGLKPTYGRVSRYGLVAFASSIDQIGPMTKNVYENAILLNAISGSDPHDLTASLKEVEDFTKEIGKDISGMKIAIPNFYVSDKIDKVILDRLNKIIEFLKEKGVTIDYIDIEYLEYAIVLYQIIALAEASSNLARFDGVRYGHTVKDASSFEELYIKSRTEGFGKEVKRRIMIGTYVLSGKNANTYYYKALKIRNKMRENMLKVFDSYDLIIGPVTTSMPSLVGSSENDALKTFYDDLLTIPVNMAGLPGMSLPIGKHEGLPIGMHIIARPFAEKTIYKLASFIESSLKEGVIND